VVVQSAEGKGQRRELVGIEVVAGMLGVGVRHVRRLVADRRIPYLKWGHLLRFDPVEIEAWIDQARQPVQPQVVALPVIRISRGRGVRRWEPPEAS
jgi:excisionase family DNA binding protein